MSDLTLITDWQADVWFDKITFYREVISPSTGDSLGYTIVDGPNPDGSWPGNYIRTPNYDIHSSSAGQSKEDNIFTANRFRTDFNCSGEALDLAEVTDRTGLSEWMSVKGAEKNRAILGYAMYYLVIPGLPPAGPVFYSG